MIRTVLKDIKKEDFGVTMCHEHFILDLDHVRKDGKSIIEKVEEVVPEIQKMMDLGVDAAIEVSTIDMYRDVKKLKKISEITHLNMVCSTGFYLAEYHPEWMNKATAEEIARIYIHELTRGIDGTDIKAGIIAEIASSPKEFVGNEKKILQAAGIASKATGAAVSTHTGKFTAFETVETLLNEGVNPDKIIIGHQDLIDDLEYHKKLLSYGVNIAFDTCGKSAYQPDEVRARNCLDLIRAGYGDHIMLSNDISRRTYFTTYGENGYTSVMKIMIPELKKLGASDEEIKKLLVDNPARVLDNDWK